MTLDDFRFTIGIKKEPRAMEKKRFRVSKNRKSFGWFVADFCQQIAELSDLTRKKETLRDNSELEKVKL